MNKTRALMLRDFTGLKTFSNELLNSSPQCLEVAQYNSFPTASKVGTKVPKPYTLPPHKTPPHRSECGIVTGKGTNKN